MKSLLISHNRSLHVFIFNPMNSSLSTDMSVIPILLKIQNKNKRTNTSKSIVDKKTTTINLNVSQIFEYRIIIVRLEFISVNM